MIHYIDEDFKDVAYHYHDFYEIYFIISGDVTYHANGIIYTLKPGDIILLNNKTLHRLRRSDAVSKTRYERMVILVDPDFIHNNSLAGSALAECFDLEAKEKSRLLRLNKEDRAAVDVLLNKFEKAYSGNELGDNILRITSLIELLVFFNRAQLDSEVEAKGEDICKDPEINRILDYFDQNIDSDLSLDAIAAHFSMEKHSLIRKFKQRMGLSPHQYIKKMRLVKARDLLQKEISVTDVCYQCGFNDYSNFIRSFSQVYGISPKKYTKAYLIKKKQ
jgi:AraC-like DNA-binding protein